MERIAIIEVSRLDNGQFHATVRTADGHTHGAASSDDVMVAMRAAADMVSDMEAVYR